LELVNRARSPDGSAPSDTRASGESIVPHRLPRLQVPIGTQTRGTVILSSLRALRKRGHEERYLALLGREHHPTVAAITAVSWLPMEFAFAHYDACDRLALDRNTIDEIGFQGGRFVNDTVFATIVKVTRTAGLTPWFPLANSPRFLARTWQGGSVAVWKLGPKEARVEWIQLPLLRIPYYRVAFCAFMRGILSAYADTVYVREIPRTSREAGLLTDIDLAVRASWV
jgi:hypothetical protein